MSCNHGVTLVNGVCYVCELKDDIADLENENAALKEQLMKARELLAEWAYPPKEVEWNKPDIRYRTDQYIKRNHLEYH